MFISIKNTSKGVKFKTSIVAYCVIDKKEVTNIKYYIKCSLRNKHASE